jgi:hypothetical protein
LSVFVTDARSQNLSSYIVSRLSNNNPKAQSHGFYHISRALGEDIGLTEALLAHNTDLVAFDEAKHAHARVSRGQGIVHASKIRPQRCRIRSAFVGAKVGRSGELQSCRLRNLKTVLVEKRQGLT